jgi:hypothetical protein
MDVSICDDVVERETDEGERELGVGDGLTVTGVMHCMRFWYTLSLS